MKIQVLGAGCQKCKNLEKVIRDVVEENHIDASIEKVEDMMDIMSYGVMMTPAMVVDGKVMVKGRVPSSKEILTLLQA